MSSKNDFLLYVIGTILLTAAWAFVIGWAIAQQKKKRLVSKIERLQETVKYLDGELNLYHPARGLQSQSRVGGILR